MRVNCRLSESCFNAEARTSCGEGLPEQVRMGAAAGQNKIVAVDLVEKQRVRLDVAIMVSRRYGGELWARRKRRRAGA
jgi:hypothetical protein